MPGSFRLGEAHLPTNFDGNIQPIQVAGKLFWNLRCYVILNNILVVNINDFSS